MVRLVRLAGHSFLLDALRPGAVVVDLGMHRGDFAFGVNALVSCNVWGAEPVPELCAALQDIRGVVAQPVAITARRGHVHLARNPGTCATVVAGLRRAGAVSQCVEALDLGTFLDGHGLSGVDLLKIDIEGAELDVLAALPPERLHVIAQITVEFHNWIDPTQTPRVNAVSDRLAQEGFTRMTISRDASDTLFVNRRLIQLGALARWVLLLRHRYIRGFVSIGRRKFASARVSCR